MLVPQIYCQCTSIKLSGRSKHFNVCVFTGPSIGSLLSQAKEIKKVCMNNWAAVELKRKNWSEAAKQATKVLDMDPSNVKALYRRAQARMGLTEFVEAEIDIKAGLLSEPDNADLQALHKRLK